MGRRNYLIEGGSGTGKTTVAEELERRGYHVVHGDRQLAYYGNPDTGEPMRAPQSDNEEEAVRWGYEHWIWPVVTVEALVADHGNPLSFFCGHSANFRHFIGLFDGVFVLDVDLETLNRRLSGRPDDEFGGKTIERDLVMRLHKAKAYVPENAVRVDASAPVARVVDEIVSKCGNAGVGS